MACFCHVGGMWWWEDTRWHLRRRCHLSLEVRNEYFPSSPSCIHIQYDSQIPLIHGYWFLKCHGWSNNSRTKKEEVKLMNLSGMFLTCDSWTTTIEMLWMILSHFIYIFVHSADLFIWSFVSTSQHQFSLPFSEYHLKWKVWRNNFLGHGFWKSRCCQGVPGLVCIGKYG